MRWDQEAGVVELVKAGLLKPEVTRAHVNGMTHLRFKPFATAAAIRAPALRVGYGLDSGKSISATATVQSAPASRP